MSRHHKKPANKKQRNKHEHEIANGDTKNIFSQLEIPLAQPPQVDSPISDNRRKLEELCHFKKSKVPHHFILHSEVVEDERMGIKDQAKKVKKIFFDICLDAQRFSVQLRRANFYPCIFLEYKSTALQTKDYVFLRDLIKESKEVFKEHKEKIHCIYACLYEVLPTHFIRLAVFGILKAKELKVKLSYKMRKEHDQCDLALYYTWDRSHRDVNFTLIDRNLTIVDFTGSSIYSHSDHEEEVALYEEFLQYLTHSTPSMLELDEMEEAPIFHQIAQETTPELQAKLKEYLAKDLKVYENSCLEKEEQILNLWADNNSDDDLGFIQRLNDEITFIKMGIQNYIQIVIEVEEELKKKGLSKYEYNAFLKRLKMAEREIESKLPILAKKEQIFKMLASQSIILIEGETGSGKSTQIPQILCQYYRLFENPQAKPVLISQPRRLATRTLAERVASELGEKLGRFVDYKSSIEKQVSPQAKIVFKLDRMVLDELSEDPLLSNYSCLVIDEAHERTISIDVIAGLIKGLVKSRPDFKVIITSASMDVELFERYFGNTRALRVSGRLHDVSVNYRDSEGESTLVKIKRVLEEQVIEENSSLRSPFSGHVLVFCHSVDEITQLTDHYQQFLNPNRFEVYPLHGKILPEEQRKAFNQTKRHKLIFASRIAETAITIDDVRVVVDPGEDYELVYNQKLKYSSMKLRQISQSSAKQRAGRAGRTAPGFCFRLYSEESFRARPLGKVPEMENSSLDTVVLRLKSLGINDLFSFSYISPPDNQGLQTSIETLKIIEALDAHEEMTAVGQILLLLPIEPILGRSLVEALFVEEALRNPSFVAQHMELSEEERGKMAVGCVRKSVVQILSMVVNSSGLFQIAQESKNESNLNRFVNFPLRDGDFFLLRSLYQEYKDIHENLGERSEFKYFLRHFFLNRKGLRQVRELEGELNRLLVDYIRLDFALLQDELADVKYKLRHCRTYNQVLLLSLAASFVPNLCRFSGNPDIGYTLIAQRRPIQIYGSSSLSLLGLTPNSPSWILAYDLYTNEKGRFYCKIAQEIDIEFLEKIIGNYAWEKFGIKDAKKVNPYYEKIAEQPLPTKIFSCILGDYMRRERDKKSANSVFDQATFLFDEDSSKVTVFVLKDTLLGDPSIEQRYRAYLREVERRLKEEGLTHAYLGTTKAHLTSHFLIAGVEKIVQSDIIISEMSPAQQRALREHLKQYPSVNVYSRANWLRIQLEDQTIRKGFDAELERCIESLVGQKPQVRRVPRNERKISQSKVLLIFKVENLLYKAAESSVQKYYNLLCEAINGDRPEPTIKRPCEWREDIENLLLRVSVNPEECAINIWKGDAAPRRRSPLVEMFAEISNIEGGVYRRLIDLQSTNEYLGCESFLIRQVFEQMLAFPSERVFTSLKEEYLAIVIALRDKYRGFNVLEKYMRLGDRFRVLVLAKSWAREELWEASTRIAALFHPRHIPLDKQEAYFLQHVDKYAIIEKLENEYKYAIALEMDWEKLFVYCPEETYDEIVVKVRAALNSSEYLTKEISYRNKSLEDVIGVISSRQKFLDNNTLSKTQLSYQIRFDKRHILLTTTQHEHDILRAEFERMAATVRHDCPICLGRATAPYRLLHCPHSACKSCLAGHLQQAFTVDNHPLLCPHSDCGQPISVHDIEAIVGAKLFEKWCDQRTTNYVHQVLKLETCQRCELVLWDPYQADEESQCNFCGFARAGSSGQ